MPRSSTAESAHQEGRYLLLVDHALVDRYARAGELVVVPGPEPVEAIREEQIRSDPRAAELLTRLAFSRAVGGTCGDLDATRERRLFKELRARLTLKPPDSGFLTGSLREQRERGALSTETREQAQRAFRRGLASCYLRFFVLPEGERFSLDRHSRGLEIVSGLAFLTAVLDGAGPDRLGEGAAQIRELLSDVAQVRQLLHRGAFQSSLLAASDYLRRAWGAGMAGARFMRDVLVFVEELLRAPAEPRRQKPPEGWDEGAVLCERLRVPLSAALKCLADQRRARGLG